MTKKLGVINMDAFYKYSAEKEELLIEKLKELSGKSNLEFTIETHIDEEADAHYKHITGIALKDPSGKRGRVIFLWKHVNQATVRIQEMNLDKALKNSNNFFLGTGTFITLLAGGPLTFLVGVGATVVGVKGKLNEKAFSKHIHSMITDIFELEEIQAI